MKKPPPVAPAGVEYFCLILKSPLQRNVVYDAYDYYYAYYAQDGGS